MQEDGSNATIKEAFKESAYSMEEQPRNNQTDYASYVRFRKERAQRLKYTAEQEQKRVSQANIPYWLGMIPRRFHNASLKNMESKTLARKLLRVIDSSEQDFSLYIFGTQGSGKSFVSYAFMRALIARGIAYPSQLLIISENDFVEMGRTGYQGQQRFKEIMSRTYGAVIVDGLGEYGAYPENTSYMLETFISHLHANCTTTVFLANAPLNEYKQLISPLMEHKIEEMVNNRFLDMDKYSSQKKSEILASKEQESVGKPTHTTSLAEFLD